MGVGLWYPRLLKRRYSSFIFLFYFLLFSSPFLFLFVALDFDMDVFTDMITRMRSCRMLALSPSAEAQCNHQRLCHALEKGIVPGTPFLFIYLIHFVFFVLFILTNELCVALGHDRRATEEHIIATLLHYTKNDTYVPPPLPLPVHLLLLTSPLPSHLSPPLPSHPPSHLSLEILTLFGLT